MVWDNKFFYCSINIVFLFKYYGVVYKFSRDYINVDLGNIVIFWVFCELSCNKNVGYVNVFLFN